MAESGASPWVRNENVFGIRPLSTYVGRKDKGILGAAGDQQGGGTTRSQRAFVHERSEGLSEGTGGC